MKTALKKLTAITLAILFLFGAAPLLGIDFATAADAKTYSGSYGAGIEWSLNTETKTLTVTGTGSVPDWWDEFWAPWDSYRDSVETIIIDNGVQGIGKNAFYSFDEATTVKIPSSVTSIGDGAFGSCEKLTNINVSSENTAYKSVDGVLFDKAGTQIIICPCGNERTSYEIPSSVVSIGAKAFFICNNLKSITYEPGTKLQKIGEFAFAYCPELTSISIPSGVREIGEGAFYECIKLTKVEFSSSENPLCIEDWAFFGCAQLAEIAIPNNVTEIGYCAFGNTAYYKDKSNWTNDELYIDNCLIIANDESLGESGSETLPENPTFASGVYTITPEIRLVADDAFNGCKNIVSINVNPDNPALKSVDGVLFDKAGKKLVKVPSGNERTGYDIPAGVTHIGNYALQYCKSLTEVTIPSGVIYIGENAFMGCENLAEVIFPNSVTRIAGRAFYGCDSLSEIEIPSSITELGDEAFYSCQNLTKVTISNNLTSLGDETFRGCVSLTDVVFSKNSKLKSISLCAFSECSKLGKIRIPASVTEIDDLAFASCDALSEVTFAPGSRLTRIKVGAFFQCKSLTNITIPDSVTGIGTSAFFMSNLETVFIPKNVSYIGISALVCGAKIIGEGMSKEEIKEMYAQNGWNYGKGVFSSIVVDEKNLVYSSENGIMYDKTKSTLITVPTGMQGVLTIPDCTTKIESIAFYGCDEVTAINIPKSLTTIAENCLRYCTGLTEINVSPENTGLKSVGGVLFDKQGETLIQYPAANAKTGYVIPESVTKISDAAFQNCSKLTEVFIQNNVTGIGQEAFRDCGSLQTVAFAPGSQLDIIPSYTFYGCENLTEITIPKSVTVIEFLAFYNCSSLTDVYYGGSESDRQNIEMKYVSEDLTSAEWHYNSEPPISVVAVSVSPTSVTLEVGSSRQLTVTVGPELAPNKAVTWASSDVTVATVDANGLVTAVSEGTATITVTSADGGKTAGCEITVAAPESEEQNIFERIVEFFKAILESILSFFGR